MNLAILNTNIQQFISQNLKKDITSILLKGTDFQDVQTKEIIEQIEAKNKCFKKLPTWFNTENIYYPNKLNIEQTSSEITAEYKAKLVSGTSIIDVTGGYGVDCFYFSKQFQNVTHCEINENLSRIVSHNLKCLGVDNIKTQNSDGIVFLTQNDAKYNWIYIDPSRRHDSKGKVFFLKDCLPNVPEHLTVLFKRSNNILIKTSPLLDISIGISELDNVKAIHIVAVNNEVKELLWILEKGYEDTIEIKTVNLKKDSKENFNFKLVDTPYDNVTYSLPLTYLYEPNSAILKSGGFKEIAHQLNVYKLHQHSHLYTSETLIAFPGRTFKVDTILPYNKKELKKLGLSKANVTTRNFPETVQQIRKKLKLKDGGNHYLFFTTDLSANKIVIVCNKL